MISLVTGIGGFVGPYLARHLVSGGHSVFGIERNPKAAVTGCRVFSCDVLDSVKVSGIVKSCSPDFVFHLAAVSSVGKSFEEPELTMRVDVDGTRNVLDAVSAHAPKATVLIVSSAHVYGIPEKLPVSETHSLNPLSPYARAKVEKEKTALGYFRSRGLKVIISRSFNHIGPGQPDGFICSDFAKQIAAIEKGAEPVIKVGNLSSKRDFTDVRDIVKAYGIAVQKCVPGEIYNVCSGKAYSAREVLSLLLGMSNKKIKVVEDNSAKRGDIPVMLGDNSKFVKATGWTPGIPFEETLRDVLGFWRHQQ